MARPIREAPQTFERTLRLATSLTDDEKLALIKALWLQMGQVHLFTLTEMQALVSGAVEKYKRAQQRDSQIARDVQEFRRLNGG